VAALPVAVITALLIPMVTEAMAHHPMVAMRIGPIATATAPSNRTVTIEITTILIPGQSFRTDLFGKNGRLNTAFARDSWRSFWRQGSRAGRYIWRAASDAP
jgi:hypothetical protein